MPKDNTRKKFARTFLVWWLPLFVIYGFIAVITVRIADPYNLYGCCRQEGVNLKKPTLSLNQEEIKLVNVEKLKADTLIFGNALAESGLDPEAPSLQKSGHLAYNLAFPDATLETARRELDYLLSLGRKPQKIIIGVDFVDFMVTGKPHTQQPVEYTTAISDFPVKHWFWQVDALLSPVSLVDAVRTLLMQDDPEAATMSSRGFNPLKDLIPLARDEGYFGLFQHSAEKRAKSYLKKSAGSYDNSDLENLRAILNTAAGMDSQVMLIIYPYHAQTLALFEETGLMPFFLQWKTDLVALSAGVKRQKPNADIKVLDFSGYGQFQCEQIPESGDNKSRTYWYWDGVRFKKTLGDIVLGLAISAPVEGETLIKPKAFGVLLNENNLTLNNQRMEDEKRQCADSYPQLFSDAHALVDRYRH